MGAGEGWGCTWPLDGSTASAWDDRNGAAKELHDLLGSSGVSVWFSEKDVRLGTTLLYSSASNERASPTKSFRPATVFEI